MNYENLTQLPQLNNVTIIGNKKFEDYGLVPISSEEVTELMLEVFGYVL
jgi:hypothetical protein